MHEYRDELTTMNNFDFNIRTKKMIESFATKLKPYQSLDYFLKKNMLKYIYLSSLYLLFYTLKLIIYYL